MDYQKILDRFTYAVDEEIIDAIYKLKSINTPDETVTSNLAVQAVEKLLRTKGMQLPMASTVLHFYFPNIYPIID